MRTTPVQTKLLENISPRFDLEVQVGMSNLDLLLKLPDEHLMEPQPSQRIVFCASCEPVEFTSNRHHLVAQFAEQIHSPNPLDKLRKVSINRTCTVIQPCRQNHPCFCRDSSVILIDYRINEWKRFEKLCQFHMFVVLRTRRWVCTPAPCNPPLTAKVPCAVRVFSYDRDQINAKKNK